MRVPNDLGRGAVGFNMTPLIDVVFQLIIFFLVSSHLAKQEAQLELDLPTAESGREAVDDVTPRVTINVLPDGQLTLGSHRVSADQLPSLLADRRDEEGDQLEVRIRSDRSVAYRDVEPIRLACARAGIWNVTFAVYRREEQR